VWDAGCALVGTAAFRGAVTVREALALGETTHEGPELESGPGVAESSAEGKKLIEQQGEARDELSNNWQKCGDHHSENSWAGNRGGGKWAGWCHFLAPGGGCRQAVKKLHVPLRTCLQVGVVPVSEFQALNEKRELLKLYYAHER
jgi:hypothetical protein